MRRAQMIMLSSRKPISQSALEGGMSDQVHFTRVFRKTIGINPGSWRRRFPQGAGAPTVNGEHDAIA